MKSITCNNVLQELENRFSKSNIDQLNGLNSLDASKEYYLDGEKVTELARLFKGGISIDESLLKSECKRAKMVINDGGSLDLNFYPNLAKMLSISKSITVGTASVERSFSAMNRILSLSRSSLNSSKASDFMVLSSKEKESNALLHPLHISAQDLIRMISQNMLIFLPQTLF